MILDMPNQKSNQDPPPQATQQATAQQSVQSPLPPRPEPEKLLFSWKAPARAFKKREREFWVRLIVIASIFGFILFIVEGAMPVVLLIALVFLFYILSTVEPETIEYAVTNKGIKVADRRNDWELFTRFWFTKRLNTDLLILETLVVPGRLELVINDSDKEKIRKTLSLYIPEEEAAPTRMDKASDWVSKKLS